MLSVVILTKNEEKNIGALLKSLTLANEIIVIDDYSSDKTVEVAKNFGAKVLQRKLDDNFAAQRNYGLEKARGDWILFIDADEVVSKELLNEIIQLINNPEIKIDGYYLKRRDIFLGKMLTGTEAGQMKLLRLIKKNSGSWTRNVHECLSCKGETGELKNFLVHNSHPNLKTFISQVNFYSTLHAQENRKEGKRSSIFKIIFYPPVKFVRNWILLGGYKDGSRGFIMSLMMSLHSFLSWSKLWLMQ